jgi:hypothetical protein
MAAIIQAVVFWFVTPRNLVADTNISEEHCASSSELEMSFIPTIQDGAPFPNSLFWARVTNFLATCLYNPTHISLKERRQLNSSKRLYPPIRPHGDTTKKATISTWLQARQRAEKVPILCFIGYHASHKYYVQVFIIFTYSSKLNGYCLEG